MNKQVIKKIKRLNGENHLQIKQGYFNHQKVIDELLKNGVVKIPFSWV